jgi:hypothetical protein
LPTPIAGLPSAAPGQLLRFRRAAIGEIVHLAGGIAAARAGLFARAPSPGEDCRVPRDVFALAARSAGRMLQ